MMPTVCPDLMCMSMFSSTFLSASAEYANFTPLKSMLPSLTAVTGCSGFLMVLSSSKTSATRLAEATDMVTITNIMDINIRLMSICML